MIQNRISKLLGEYSIGDIDTSIRVTETYISFDVEGLPVLPFFFDLATECLVPITNIRCDHAKGHEGCETCGYGGECTFEVRIKLP
jgi:hypothetical protein